MSTLPSLGLACLALAMTLADGLMAAETAAPRRVYSRLLEPTEHPDYDRRAVKPPTWTTFKLLPQFTCLRGFRIQDGQAVGFVEDLEKFTRKHELGDVIWPSYQVLFAKNIGDVADEIRRRDLYLFDVGGYVPGSGPGGLWQQFTPPAAALKMLESTLGERWLGTDIGEQDGRYIGAYAGQMTPASADRLEQYLNFQRHFERMGDDLGHKHTALVALTFGHYLLKEGTYVLLGAETAQVLPNSQVTYAFIRGAGKQHGVPWFGNVSIFNRWGHKSYDSTADGATHGPTLGTSLSLMKRLLYSHILYNCVAVGFESGWLAGDGLSPIGEIQRAAQRWVKTHGQPGVMHTPVALLLDFHAGWTVPRHMDWSPAYRVWGNLPYEPGDYLTDAVFDLLYPGYQDASYFHDESGFLAPTPYGDIADCLLSDAPPWVLERYPAVIVAGALRGGREIRDKLQAYAERGGHVVVTAGNLARLPGGLAGRTEAVDATVPCGRGRVTFFASPFGVQPRSPAETPLRSEIDKPLSKPYALEPGVRSRLDQVLREQQLFNVRGTGLSLVTCRARAGEYTLGIANNTWREQPFRIESFCGGIESLREIPLDQSEKGAIGQTPIGVDTAGLGTSGTGTIAGGDIRIFAVTVRESGVVEIPHATPPPRPHDRILTLRRASSIKEEILARPTFFEHHDGVCVDWRMLHEREEEALRAEARWLGRQRVRIVVDLSSGLNLYPTLRLLDNVPADFEASMAVWADVLAKMQVLGAKDLVFSLHRDPENNFTGEQANAGYWSTLKRLAGQAAAHGVTLHLRVGPGKPPRDFPEAFHYLDPVEAPNLKLAVATAMLEDRSPDARELDRLKGRVGMWLVAAPRKDIGGAMWDTHAPFHTMRDAATIEPWLSAAPAAPVVFDALYEHQDDEYLDAIALDRLLKKP